MTALFQSFQQDMARHLRDPHHTMRPAGVPARRMAVYNEMLFNNVCGFIDTCMPLSRKLLAGWRKGSWVRWNQIRRKSGISNKQLYGLW